MCRLFNIQGTPVAGEIPSYIAYNTGSSLPSDNTVAGKDMDTEHVWMNWEHKFLKDIPIWDSMQNVTRCKDNILRQDRIFKK